MCPLDFLVSVKIPGPAHPWCGLPGVGAAQPTSDELSGLQADTCALESASGPQRLLLNVWVARGWRTCGTSDPCRADVWKPGPHLAVPCPCFHDAKAEPA